MKKTGSNKIKIVSLDPVLRDGWMFKVSSFDGTILVHSYNEQMHWSNIRYFQSESLAHNFIEYLCLQSENLK